MSSYIKRRNVDPLNPTAAFSQTQELPVIAEKTAGHNIGGPSDDKASIITTAKLKKFNDIFGYDHGPATKPADDEEDQEEAQDRVNEMLPGRGSKTNLLEG